MPVPFVVAPFLLIRVGMFLVAGAVSVGLYIARNTMPEEKKDADKDKK